MTDAQKAQHAVIRLHLWMERDGETMFGLGRLHLLERIDALGSIKSAADQLGMSYRAAWGKLKASEEALGLALIEKVGGNKSGCRLTADGHALAEAFRAWFASVERHAVCQANVLFPFACHRFAEAQTCPPLTAENSYATQNISISLIKV